MWRTGAGIDRHGNLIYVAADYQTVTTLARILQRAGAVRAMELDIHKGMVTFNLFTHDPGIVGHKLLADMPKPAERYLVPDWRDFLMVTPAP